MSKKPQETSSDAATGMQAGKTAILVVGMHRSGTSAFTRLTSLLGAALPTHILGANPTNPAGHWEPATIVQFNDRLLAEAGSSWDDWRALDLSSQLSPSVLQDFSNQLGTIIATEFGDNPFVVIKDPRIARLVDFYVSRLAANGYRSLCVIPFREPAAVINSLSKRDEMTTDYAAVMWLRHILAAESATRTLPRSFVAFEATMLNWRLVATKVETDLRINWPRRPEDATPEIDAFLKPELWHHHEKVFCGSPAISRWLEKTFAALIVLAADPADSSSMKSLDQVVAELSAQQHLIDRAVLSELTARKRKRQHSAVGGQSLQKTEAQLASAGKLLSAAQDEVHAAEDRAEELRSQLDERDKMLAGLEDALSVKAEEMRRLQSSQYEVDGQIEEFRSNSKEDKRLIAELRHTVEISTVEATRAETEHNRRKEELEMVQLELATSQSQLDILSSEIARLKSSIEYLEAKLLHSKSQLFRSNSELAASKSALSEAERRLIDQNAKDGEIRAEAFRLSNDLAATLRREEAIQRQIEDRDRTIHGLQSDIVSIRSKLELETVALAEEVRGRELEVSQLMADYEAAHTKVGESHKHNLALGGRLDQAKNQIRLMEDSLSWRITTPFRSMRRGWWLTKQLLGARISLSQVRQLEPQLREDGLSQWRMTGTDPNVELSWNSPYPLAPGHYLMIFEAPEAINALIDPKLYADTGDGYNESEAVMLRPFGRDDRTFRTIFTLPNGAGALRFDPSIRQGTLVMGPMSLRRLTRAQFYAHLIGLILRTRKQQDGSIWPAVGRGLGAIRNQGLRESMAALRSTAQRIAETNSGGPKHGSPPENSGVQK